MGIEELELELKDLKASAYDMSKQYAEFTKKIDEVTDRLEKLKESTKEDVVQIASPEVNVAIQEEQMPVIEENQVVQENTPVEEQTSQIDENVILPPVENVQGEVQVPVVEESVVAPVEKPVEVQVPQVEGNVSAEVQALQTPSQEPLTPVGVEIPSGESVKTENNVFVKNDLNEPKAILVNEGQGEKLRKSKDQAKGMVFNKQDEAVATPESKDEINKQLELMFEQLRTTTDEAKANEINNEISMLTKKLGEVA